MTIERELGELHTKVDHLIELVGKQNGRVGDLEEDVHGLRRWQSYIIGIFTAAGTGLGAALSRLFP